MTMVDDSEQVVVLTRWGARWLRFAWNLVVDGTRKEVFTKAILRELDSVVDDPEDFIDGHVHTSKHVITNSVGETVVGEVVRTKKVIRKGRRSSFAAAIAHEAYNKFGARPLTEANVLVTRKWLQKLLEEKKYADLRTCDRNIAIDRALFLSFVPSDSFRAMKLAVATNAWKDRCDDSTVFGKVFRLVGRGKPALQGPVSYDIVA
nr:tombus P33-like protein [Tolivirales sp.]